jgi:hypothetical protein
MRKYVTLLVLLAMMVTGGLTWRLIYRAGVKKGPTFRPAWSAGGCCRNLTSPGGPKTRVGCYIRCYTETGLNLLLAPFQGAYTLNKPMK